MPARDEQQMKEREDLIEVYRLDNGQRFGHVSSLDAEGLTIVANDEIALEPEKIHELRLSWNQNTGWTENAEFRAEVLWSREGVGTDTWEAGLRFLDPDAAVPNLVARILENHPDLDAANAPPGGPPGKRYDELPGV
jgi:hypothetical protein